MRNKAQNPQLNHLSIKVSLVILLLNTLGTLAWIHLYTIGKFTEWWAIGLAIMCGITAVMIGVKLWKKIRRFFF